MNVDQMVPLIAYGLVCVHHGSMAAAEVSLVLRLWGKDVLVPEPVDELLLPIHLVQPRLQELLLPLQLREVLLLLVVLLVIFGPKPACIEAHGCWVAVAAVGVLVVVSGDVVMHYYLNLLCIY